MKIRRHYWLFGIAVIALVVLGFSVLNSVQRAIALQERVWRDIRYAMWSTSQASIELEHFLLAATAYVGGDGKISHEDVARRFDVFWSRIPILMKGSETAAIRAIPRTLDGLHTVMDTLKKADPIVAGLKPGDTESLRSLMVLFDPVQRFLQNLYLEVHIGKVWREAYTEKLTRSTWVGLLFSVLGTLIAVFTLISLLILEVRRSRILLRSAEASQRALADSELQHRLITNNLPVLIAYIDTEGCYRFANETCAKWFACPVEDILSRPVEQVEAGFDSERIRARVSEALDKGAPVTFEETGGFADGETRNISGVCVPHTGTDARPLGAFIMVQDVTERAALEDQLRSAQKLEAVGRVTGGVAHEFNNLLMAITGNLEFLLERDFDDIEITRERLERILNTAFRGKDLTGRLLSYTGNPFDKPEIIDTGATIVRAVDFLGPVLGEAISVNVELADALWPINVDPSEFENALANLVINARDAIPDRGTVTISAVNTVIDSSFSAGRLYAVETGDYVCVSVSDNGMGMSPEIVSHVFDPFFTTKEVGKGTGLGLSMVYGFVHRRSGGYVDIDSETGRGTTVSMYFPRARANAEESLFDRPKGAHDAQRRTILLVEDDGELREALQSILELSNFTVLCAADGAEALSIMGPDRHIDVFLTDVVLPGELSGVDLADRVRHEFPEISIILMSGYAKAELAAKGAVDGRYPLLFKPFRSEELLDVLSAAVGPENTVRS